MAKRGGLRGKPVGRKKSKSTRPKVRKKVRKSPPPKPKKSKTRKPRGGDGKRRLPSKKRAKAPARGRRKTPRQPSRPHWVDAPVLGPFDRPLAQQAEFASAYCRKWMAVHDWAMDNVPGDVTLRNGDPRRRIAEGMLVRDPEDSEEAAERGIPLQDFIHLPDGPNQEQGGKRRVTIKLLTWVWDVRQQDAYQPQWGTFGSGLTAQQASRQFNRYVQDYIHAVSKGIESRRLVVTGMSIVWWTSAPEEMNYV